MSRFTWLVPSYRSRNSLRARSEICFGSRMPDRPMSMIFLAIICVSGSSLSLRPSARKCSLMGIDQPLDVLGLQRSLLKQPMDGHCRFPVTRLAQAMAVSQEIMFCRVAECAAKDKPPQRAALPSGDLARSKRPAPASAVQLLAASAQRYRQGVRDTVGHKGRWCGCGLGVVRRRAVRASAWASPALSPGRPG